MKLSPWVWVVLGLSICLGALSFAYFQHYQPNMTEAEALVAQGDALQTEVDKMPRVVERRDAAIEAVKQIGAEWQAVVAEKTPPATLAEGGIDLAVNRWDLTVDARKFRNHVQLDINRQMKAGGVLVIGGVTVPEPTDNAATIMTDYFNYPVIKFPVCIFNLGTVTVRGTWSQIRANVQGWSTMPDYLAMTDGLALTGTSPNLTGTYNLVVVAYIRGNVVPKEIPEGQVQLASGAPGAAPGAIPNITQGGGPGAAPATRGPGGNIPQRPSIAAQ
ncbi:MAG: hypothetical protein KF812_09205 [Fimbriimonadaceae bacterium]|nr:hypothetical protein [Fimbriimonadaceae bacterium]